MFKYLQQVQPQTLLLLMGSIILLTLLAAYLYVFKTPLNTYRQAQQTVELLQNEINTGISLPNQLAATQNTVSQLEQQLHGSAPSLPINQKIALVIGKLDEISAIHKVNLNSVKPGEVAQAFMFQELPFNIEISGSYFTLVNWLHQAEQDLGPIIIKEFIMYSDAASSNVSMKLKLASYLFTAEDKP